MNVDFWIDRNFVGPPRPGESGSPKSSASTGIIDVSNHLIHMDGKKPTRSNSGPHGLEGKWMGGQLAGIQVLVSCDNGGTAGRPEGNERKAILAP